MTDRELLELAAKASGELTPSWYGNDAYFEGVLSRWNPLIDDGDALRLAVKLKIPVFPYDDETSTGTTGVVAKNWGGKEANTRRAIVRAAASIGEKL